jgi:hypothetical protein
MRTEESIKHTIMGIVASTVKLPSGDGEAIAERIIEMLTEEGNLIIPHVRESGVLLSKRQLSLTKWMIMDNYDHVLFQGTDQDCDNFLVGWNKQISSSL